MAMQRYTIKISYEEGRKLGLVLVDAPVPDIETYESDEDDWSDDGTPIVIRGGGAIEIEDDSSAEKGDVAGGDEGAANPSSNENRIGAEAEAKAKAEAASAAASLRADMAAIAASRVAQQRVAVESLSNGSYTMPPSFANNSGYKIIPPPAKPPAKAAQPNTATAKPPTTAKPPSKPPAQAAQPKTAPQPTRVNNKRKRATRVCISPNSIVFLLQKRILDLNNGEDDIVGDSCPCPSTTSIDVADLLDLARKSNISVKFRNGMIQMSDINEQVMAFVLTGTIKPDDIVERIQYTTKQQPEGSEQMAKVISVRGGNNSKRKRRSQPYFWSEHYTTFQSENKSINDVVSLLRSSENYPLYITLKRPTKPDSMAKGSTDAISPPRKRLKTDTSSGGQLRNGANDVICLLESSDEEEEIENKEAEATPKKSKSNDDTKSQPQTAPPDPLPLPHYDDDFVLTPYGPGKILSSRVERYASTYKNSEATIYNPTRIYTVDLHFGTCHVPASKVKRITGTSYTEKTLITYQRVPITEHDLLRLRPMTYLNDSIINFYLKYLKSTFAKDSGTLNSNRGWDDLDGEGVHIFPSFCYTRIKNIMGPATRNSKMVRTKIWKDLASWTKKVDIFKKKLLVFPINEHLHWTCVFVCHPGRGVRRYAKELHHVNKGSTVKVEKSTTNNAPRPAASIPPAYTNSNSSAAPPTKLAAIPSHVAVKLATGFTVKQPGNKPSSSSDKVVPMPDTNDANVAGDMELKLTADEKASRIDSNTTKSSNSQPTIASNTDTNVGEKMEDKSTSTSDGLQGNEKTLLIRNTAAVDVSMETEPMATSDAPQPTSNIEASTDNNSREACASDVKSNAEAKPENELKHSNQPNQSKAANENPSQSLKPGTKWQCDFCKEAKFDDFDEACAHEETCTKNFANTDWCMIHFDSGKHFKLHNSNEIMGNIRKYLNAYYEAEYQATHPGLTSFTMKNMPGFAAAIPQQDNTKDCGVFMLENAERMICKTPTIDSKWLKRKGSNKNKVFETHTYGKQVIEKKREDLLQLIQTLRRGQNEID